MKSVQEQRHITPVRDLGNIFTSKILTIWSRCPPEIVSVTLLENNPVKFVRHETGRDTGIFPQRQTKYLHLYAKVFRTIWLLQSLIP